MTLPRRVSDLAVEPIVGETYLVPCVHDRRAGWLPILGPAHADPEIVGQPHEHWHFDARFLNAGQLRSISQPGFGIEPDKSVEEALAVVQFVRTVNSRLEDRPLVCLRSVPEFMTSLSRTELPVSWLPELEAAYVAERLACLRCPHKGMPLTGMPVKDGLVVCPGHGLRWNVESGEMVRRTVAA